MVRGCRNRCGSDSGQRRDRSISGAANGPGRRRATRPRPLPGSPGTGLAAPPLGAVPVPGVNARSGRRYGARTVGVAGRAVDAQWRLSGVRPFRSKDVGRGGGIGNGRACPRGRGEREDDESGIGRLSPVLVANGVVAANAHDGLARGNLTCQETLHATAHHEGFLVLRYRPARIARSRCVKWPMSIIVQVPAALSMDESNENSENIIRIKGGAAASVGGRFGRRRRLGNHYKDERTRTTGLRGSCQGDGIGVRETHGT